MLSHLLSRDLVAFTLYARWESETLALLMESYRCGQTMEESPAVVEVIVRPDEPLSSQDITVSSSSYCSSSSALRIAENSQLPAVHFVTRTDSADCHMPSVVSRPSQLPMDNRRNSWTQGESTIDNMTTMFSPNFPLSQDIFSSSTSLVSSSSSASLSRVVDYPQLSYTNVFTRPDFTGSHFIAGMNIPPQLPMDDRQLSHGVPLVQDSSIASACFSTSSPFSTLSRVNDYSQSFPMGFIPRVDFRDTHVTSGVNLSPQLPMDNRRESQTAGESTVNTSTAIFRPLNVPAMSAFRSSRASSTLAQSTYPIPRGSAASLPANGVRIFTLACCILMSNNLAGYQSFYTHALLFHTQSFCTVLGRFIPSHMSFSIPILIECVFHCYI